MNWKELYEKMQTAKMISPNWRNVLALLDQVAKNDEQMKLFVIYFSLIDDGNVYMKLDKSDVSKKIEQKAEQLNIQNQDNEDNKKELIEEIVNEINDALKSLSKLKELDIIDVFNDNPNPDEKNHKALFVIDKNRLFTKKYYNAVCEIKSSKDRLLTSNAKKTNSLIISDIMKSGFMLSTGQEEIIEKGYYNNLLVTGGPGTGKTTSILFLLISLLEANPNYNIYLTAPSGKAAARMKESIIDGCGNIERGKVAATVEKIKNVNEYTIHRLLGNSYENGGFSHNKNNRFSENSIFIIDEASMIDVCIFASLLEAIPDKARVFILGDKNQLPSVECGAVFGELLEDSEEDSKVTLKESQRFRQDSEIYNLSESINQGVLPSDIVWKDYENFEIGPKPQKGETPIYYYSDMVDDSKAMVEKIINKWYEEFYSNLKAYCDNIVLSQTITDNDKAIFDNIEGVMENARILCADNESVRGVKHINKRIIKNHFDPEKKVSGFYPGELVMITKNNKPLDIYNGDSGVAVTFDGDETMYIMFKKKTSLNLDNDIKLENRIFKIGDYIFYPARLISREEITTAFAITIHKSQGSDYNNILVIFPKTKGHPLLNRQIVYTAITRTKGSTYILSNNENLEYASVNRLTRDTGII